eukprot:scaffold234757_cov44-Prasinocladus_malaysianus.AAC.3
MYFVLYTLHCRLTWPAFGLSDAFNSTLNARSSSRALRSCLTRLLRFRLAPTFLPADLDLRILGDFAGLVRQEHLHGGGE